MTPLFLLSLPRSGSTLLQRILATHRDVATTAEPWLLLPIYYSLRRDGHYSEYYSDTAADAIRDFCDELPDGIVDFRREVADMASRLYRKAAKREVRYFLDKTPRYHLIADELLDTFSDAKFLILWRHPLAIAASMIESYAKGQWNLWHFYVDLYKGMDQLIRLYQEQPDRFHVIGYEQLLSDPERICRELFSYLDLDFDPLQLEHFNGVKFNGRMGDHTGVKTYTSISTQSLNRWKQSFCNPIRKRWGGRYLQWIGEERLRLMGYELEELKRDLASAPSTSRYLLTDTLRMSYGVADGLFDIGLARRKIRLHHKQQHLYIVS